MGTITITNLGKAYKQYPNRWSRLVEWLVPFSKSRHQLKWVLQDLNFKVNAGEAIGIIGINGAGKSTLLKMITGTTKPSGTPTATPMLAVGYSRMSLPSIRLRQAGNTAIVRATASVITSLSVQLVAGFCWR